MKAQAAAAEPNPPGHRPELLGLRGVRGQPAVTEALRHALRGGRPHHAYLFDGPEGIGKATTARALFCALNCEAPPAPGDACGSCGSCSKVASGNHPDLIPFDMSTSGLADEADKLVRRLQFPPFEGRAQLVIFDPADQFTVPTALVAANRLLKSIEEPRPQTYFVLVSSAASGLLPTLRSRCQRLRFVPLSDEAMAEELHTRHHAAPEDVQRVVKLAQGSLGRALRSLQDREGLWKRLELAESLAQAAHGEQAARMVEVASDVGADREEAMEVLELLWLRWHGALQAAVARAASANDLAVGRLLAGLRSIREAQWAIRRYTSAPLALERLLRLLAAQRAAGPAPPPAPAAGAAAP